MYYLQSKYIQEILLKDENESHFSSEKLRAKFYDNAIILPRKGRVLSGGVCGKDGSYIPNTGLHETYDGSYQYGLTEEKRISKIAVYCGTWAWIYGHIITDNIKKLWFLFTQQGQAMLSNPELYDFVYVDLANGTADYMSDILNLLGIDKNRLKPIRDIVRYSQVVVPDNSLIYRGGGVRLYTTEYKELIDRIKYNCQDSYSYEKIYLTRSAIHDGKDFNEKCIEKEFLRRGYRVVSPEKMTFHEQVSMMKGVSRVVATVGSISHNILFCQDGVSVVLLNKSNFVNGYQLFINKMRHCNVTYIDAHHSAEVTYGGPFFLFKSKPLCQYLGIRYRSYIFTPVYYRYLFVLAWRKIRAALSKKIRSIIKK